MICAMFNTRSVPGSIGMYQDFVLGTLHPAVKLCFVTASIRRGARGCYVVKASRYWGCRQLFLCRPSLISDVL